MEKQIVIVGLGLLGSSLAMSLRQHHYPAQIIGISSPSSCQKALELGICDQVFGYEDFAQWKSTADLILLCTPIEHIFQFASALQAEATPFKNGCIITDVGSTKAQVCQQLGALFGNDALFVGGHPMAGSEKSGIAGGDPSLYESALWILCPPNAECDLSLLTDLIQVVGGRSLILNPIEHDQFVARISHTPQLISSLLAATAGQQINSLGVAGPGFRDMSRLALSNFAMWKSILATNQGPILEVLTDFKVKLDHLVDIFAAPKLSMESLESVFEDGRLVREQLHIPLPQFRQGLCDLVVQIPDQPGMIASAISPLSAAGIDIRDVELMRVRDGVGGTLRLAFKNRSEAEKAISVLAAHNLHSWLKNS